jgi:hypothetical protein
MLNVQGMGQNALTLLVLLAVFYFMYVKLSGNKKLNILNIFKKGE